MLDRIIVYHHDGRKFLRKTVRINLPDEIMLRMGSRWPIEEAKMEELISFKKRSVI